MNLLHVIARQWRQRPLRTALSIASVAIAVAAVLGTALAQSSVRQGVQQLSQTVDRHPAVEVISQAGGRFPAADVPKISDIPGVKAAMPLVARGSLGRVKGKTFRGVLLGLSLADPLAWKQLELVSGRLPESAQEVVISEELAKSLQVELNDRLSIVARKPRGKTIVGFARAASLDEFAPAANVVLSLDEVQSIFSLQDSLDRVRVVVDSADEREAVLGQIAERLPATLTVQTPQAPTEMIDSTLRSTELALRLAGAMSMAMAAFIILNTLRLNFSERRRDVAVLRVLGASQRQLVTLQLTEGLALGTLGSLFGAPAGLWLGQLLERVMGQLLAVEIPAPELSYSALALALALGPVVAGLAALAPAWQSRQISPTEALGDVELRRAERFPRWAVFLGIVAWLLAVTLVTLVAQERIRPEFAIPAGLLMLVAFISVIPAVVRPLIRATSWLLAFPFDVESRLAGDQLLARSTRTALTAGVLVVALSAGLGLGAAIVNNVHDVRDWHRRAFTGDVIITDPTAKDRVTANETEKLSGIIREQPGVGDVLEMRFLPARSSGVPVVCVAREFSVGDELPWAMSPDELQQLPGKLRAGEVALGGVMARKLGVQAGDSLRLELQGRVFSLPIGAVVNDYLFGGRIAYLDSATAAKLVELGPAEMYLVTADQQTDKDALATQLEKALLNQGVVVQSFGQLRRQLDALINGVVAALWGLLAVGFVVGGVAVSNTLTLNVLEQTRELGLLRIIGMSGGQIRRLVFCESLLLGMLGAVLGTAGGLTTAIVIHVCNQPVLDRTIPFSVPLWLVAANVAGCLLIAVLSAWRPARGAARLDLLTAISYE